MITNPVSGAWYLIRGFSLLNKPGIRAYVIIPLLINISFFSAVIAVGMRYFDTFLDQLMPVLPDWLTWLSGIFWILFLIAALLIAFYTFSLIANIFSAPFNGLLAEAVEEYLTGRKPELAGGWKKAFTDLVPSMLAEFKKTLYFAAWALLFALFFIIPVVQIIAPFIWMLYTAWALALEYLDYPMANHGYKFPDNKNKMSKRLLQSLGFGLSTSVATLIPIANFLVMPASVAGATALWVEKFQPALTSDSVQEN